MTHYLDTLLFAVLPYAVMVVFFLGTIQRYRAQSFSYSSLSSQFLENRQHFWALVPFHYGILIVLAGHIVAFLVPRQLLLWNSEPLRLYILEASALAFGITTLVSLGAIIVRRLTVPKIKVVTTTADWVVYALLLFQVVTGVYIAVFRPWGSSWFAASAAPYLWSLIKLNPEIGVPGGHAVVGEAPHRQRLSGDRLLPVLQTGPHPGGTQHVSLAPAASRALERRPSDLEGCGPLVEDRHDG